MSKFPSMGSLDGQPGAVRRSDLEDRIRQLRAVRSDAWSIAALPYVCVLPFQAISNTSSTEGRRIYFRPPNPQQSVSMTLTIMGGGSEKDYVVRNSNGDTILSATTDTLGDAVVTAPYLRVHEAGTSYFFEVDGDGTWGVDVADLAISFNSIGLVPPGDLELGVRGPVLPGAGAMNATAWNTFFTELEGDYDQLVAASSFYRMRFCCMVYEPTGLWTDKDPVSYIFDVADKFGGEALASFEVWSLGSDGEMVAAATISGASEVLALVEPASPANNSLETTALAVDGSGVGTPIRVELYEDFATTSLERAYVVMNCRPVWE
jgi:hypothetical protein